MQVEGRTGKKRSNLYATLIYDEEADSYSLRVDDSANLEFWLTVTLSQEILNYARIAEVSTDSMKRMGEDGGGGKGAPGEPNKKEDDQVESHLWVPGKEDDQPVIETSVRVAPPVLHDWCGTK